VLGESRYLEAALGLARFLRQEMAPASGLLRTWRQGRGHTPGFLEDYGAVAAGLVDLYETCFDPAWLRWAGELADTLRARFEDPDQGGFYGSADPDGDLLFRHKPLQDGAMPSGNTLAARALLRLAGHLDRPGYRASVAGILRCAAPLLAQAPGACLGLLGVLELAESSLEVVITGDPSDPRTQALVAAAWRPCLPNRILSLAEADPELPLHRGRTGLGPAALICRDQTCSAPITDPALLEAALRP
jgi:uncharacterized protein YyaL (SSP411 family)